MTARSRILGSALAALTLTLTMGGCMTDDTSLRDDRGDDTVIFPMSKEESQGLIWGVESEVVSLLPAGMVLEVKQATDDNSLTCAPGGVMWTGLTLAKTVTPPDPDELLAAIRARWGQESGYTVDVETMSDGAPLITLSGPRHDDYLIEAYGTTLEVRSFGPCVRRDA